MSATTRFMFMPNAGEGNPNQYPIISPCIANALMRPNYRLTAINVDPRRSENFVIFARPLERFNRANQPCLNDADIVRVFDFIYGTVFQNLMAGNYDDDSIVVELDVNGCPDVQQLIDNLRCLNPNAIVSSLVVHSPMARILSDELRRRSRENGRELTLAVVYRQYVADECRAYFFPGCQGECHCGRE